MTVKQKTSLVVLGSKGYIGQAICNHLAADFEILDYDLQMGLDITKTEDRSRFIKENRQKTIVGIINCIGFAVPNDIYYITSQDLTKSLVTNVLAPALLIRDLEPFMQKKNLVLFSSVITSHPTVDDFGYFLSKRGVEALGDYLKFFFKVLTIAPKVLPGGMGAQYYPVVCDDYKDDLDRVVTNVVNFIYGNT